MAMVGTILTSAAVGALVSSAIALVSQKIERKARRQEITMQGALHLAERRVKTIMEMAEKSGRGTYVEDDVTLVETYYRELEHLFRHGRLSADAVARREQSLQSFSPQPPQPPRPHL